MIYNLILVLVLVSNKLQVVTPSHHKYFIVTHSPFVICKFISDIHVHTYFQYRAYNQGRTQRGGGGGGGGDKSA